MFQEPMWRQRQCDWLLESPDGGHQMWAFVSITVPSGYAWTVWNRPDLGIKGRQEKESTPTEAMRKAKKIVWDQLSVINARLEQDVPEEELAAFQKKIDQVPSKKRWLFG